MKYKIQTEPEPFTPRSITITFESQAELDAFGALFNSSPIGAALREVGAGDLRLYNAFTELGGRIDPYNFDEAVKRIYKTLR